MKKKVIQLTGISFLLFAAMLAVDLAFQPKEELFLNKIITTSNAQIVCPGPDKTGGGCHIMYTVHNVPSPYGPATCTYCEWTGYMDDYCDPYFHQACETPPTMAG